jgi:hypothetical protein
MGSVGLFSRSSFSYFRGTEKERIKEEDLFERCQLVVMIERFELLPGL